MEPRRGGFRGYRYGKCVGHVHGYLQSEATHRLYCVRQFAEAIVFLRGRKISKNNDTSDRGIIIFVNS
jgi:hypothetical protein